MLFPLVLVAVNESRQRGVRPGNDNLIGPRSNPKGDTGRWAIKTCVQEPIMISSEPEDYDGRETGRNPANGNKIRA